MVKNLYINLYSEQPHLVEIRLAAYICGTQRKGTTLNTKLISLNCLTATILPINCNLITSWNKEPFSCNWCTLIKYNYSRTKTILYSSGGYSGSITCGYLLTRNRPKEVGFGATVTPKFILLIFLNYIGLPPQDFLEN